MDTAVRHHYRPYLSANTQMENDVTPVYLAAQEGHLEVLKFLVLEAGGSLYIRAKDGMAPVHAAAQMGCLPCLKWMIQEQGVEPDLRDGDGATPLHFAASRGHVDCVRWLLRHGATLVLDKYGKSPINDAAENQQMECLNVLVQHGTTPDYHEEARYHGKLHGCTCRTADPTTRCSYADCVNYTQEPFYLHGPISKEMVESPVIGNKDGIYINPMVESQDPFYLHNPGEVPYHRVKQLFQAQASILVTTAPVQSPPPPPPPQSHHQAQPQIPSLTVKVEVHNSSSGSSCEDSRASVTEEEPIKESNEPTEEPDYEDIYLVAQDETGHDSGKHSRCPSVSSINSNVVHDASTLSPESGMSSASPSDLGHSEEENEKAKINANHTQSLPHPGNNSRMLKRVVSEPGGVGAPPPPPPMPSADEDSTPASSLPPPSPPVSRHESSLPSLQRSPSTLSGNTETSTVEQCSDNGSGVGATVGVGATGVNLVNKQMVLPFILPKFSGHDPDALIKPSEYLKSIISTSAAPTASTVGSGTGANPVGTPLPGTGMGCPPPPPPPPVPAPPPPPPPASVAPAAHDQPKHSQPLSTISIHDLNSVRLRHTKQPAVKTMSCPPRSLSGLVNQPFQAQKEDLIAELKLSKDITGIKKLKVERVKNEEKHEKELVTELSKQFSMEHFVEKIPEKDSAGNPIPPWKRQMLAKKAADKARKEMEQQLAKEAEEKRLQSIPAWKRHLMQTKKGDDKYDTPAPPRPVSVQHQAPMPPPDDKKVVEIKNTGEAPENKENNKPEPVKSETKPIISNNNSNSDDDNAQIIPWRAHLKKTNSTLNLLE